MNLDYKVEWKVAASLHPNPHNARQHTRKQIKQIAKSIKTFGFTNPVLITEQGVIVAGHGRVEAAKLIGLESVPTIQIAHLNETEQRAYVTADNKLALNAGWDRDILAIELQALGDLGFDLDVTGFSTSEIDFALDQAHDASPDVVAGPEDEIQVPRDSAVNRRGDLWALGRHKLLCGDARESVCYQSLFEGRKAKLVFTDPPYNVPIDGHVCGLGRIRHREFPMASGEMTEAEFTDFLSIALGEAVKVCDDGALAFVCMDWRHMGELLAAGKRVFSELKNVCVWNKNNAGMGSFYRSKHELIAVFKVGSEPHINNFGLGDGGRYRTNVWDYPGISSAGANRNDTLAMHPTVKPTALVADAIRDCSKRGQLVLDPFAGSGTTLIAAEVCGRSARVAEYDPLYCDTIIRRYEKLVEKSAVLTSTGADFDAVADEREGIVDGGGS